MLEGRHVIGLFMLMLLFSGVFFTLGYVMGRNQYDGQVRAATDLRGLPNPDVLPKKEIAPKSSSKKSAPEPQAAPSAPGNSDWEFYHAGDSNKVDDRLKPVATSAPVPAPAKSANSPKPVIGASKTNVPAPLGTGGGLNLQVAAMTKEADAMTLANNLRKKNFPTFVQSPQGDKYYHVLVGPYADQKAADIARKGLEAAGFKAIVKH
ncbi:MAG: SPOR domain-containing protein [Candidatus Acidiferrum sp.]